MLYSMVFVRSIIIKYLTKYSKYFVGEHGKSKEVRRGIYHPN